MSFLRIIAQDLRRDTWQSQYYLVAFLTPQSLLIDSVEAACLNILEIPLSLRLRPVLSILIKSAILPNPRLLNKNEIYKHTDYLI